MSHSDKCEFIAAPDVKKRIPFEGTDCIKKWLFYEAFSNHPQFVRTQSNVKVKGVALNPAIQKEKTELWIAPGFSEIESLINKGTSTVWFQHPTNTSTRVPYSSNVAKKELSLEGAYTASRSIAFSQKGKLFSIKMPTNLPVGAGNGESEFQGEDKGDKDLIDELVKVSEPLYKYIQAVSSELKPRPRSYKLLPDIASVRASGGNGFLIRDLSEMEKGGVILLPLHSLPIILSEISKNSKISRIDLMQKTAGRLVGRAQAEIYFDFGLELTTPHMQQFVLAFDKNWQPKDFIFVRDLTDS